MNKKTTGAIILAAGNSSRLGSPKQLLVWQGETLIRRTVRIALAADIKHICVVTGAQQAAIQDELAGLSVEILPNPAWKQGMGSSLQLGLQNKDILACDHILMLVCDQPFLSTAYLNRLIDTMSDHAFRAVVSAYADTLGVPAIFATSFLANQSIINPRQGAKQFFKHIPPAKLGSLSFPKGEIDIDTQEDWQNLRSDPTG